MIKNYKILYIYIYIYIFFRFVYKICKKNIYITFIINIDLIRLIFVSKENNIIYKIKKVK